MKFNELNIDSNLLKGLNECGYTNMTDIQEKCFKYISDRKDILAMSNTGSGKTLAYLVPAINNIEKGKKILILCPTRELVIQVSSTINKISKYTNISYVTLYGGKEIKRQIISLRKGRDVIIGTTGRTLDLLKKKELNLRNVSTFILDEADEMLDMGFREDVNEVMMRLPKSCQKLFFSATITSDVIDFANSLLHGKYENIKCMENDTLVVNNIEQIAIDVKQKMKNECTYRIIIKENARNSIIFCNTKKNTTKLYEYLKEKNIKVKMLDSDISQDEREKIMKKFRRGEFDSLVVTDVLSRGIDIENLDLVISYDIPFEKEYYVHRAGRTSRMGKSGKTYIFYTGKEIEKIKRIEEFAKINFKFEDVPLLDNEESDNMVKIKFNVGKNDSIKAKDFVGALGANCGLSSSKIGKIEVGDNQSIVEIPLSYKKDVENKFRNGKIKNIDVKIIED